MEEKWIRGTPHQRDMVRVISATTACQAAQKAPEETLDELGIEPSARQAVFESLGKMASRSGEQIPNAMDLLTGEENDFINALAIIVVPENLRERDRDRRNRIAVVSRPFGYVGQIGKARVAVVVPERYVTDFASIPSGLQWLISPFGRHAEAAVIHDWLYTVGDEGDGKNRKLADRVFRRALGRVGVGFFVRNLMFWAVRFGGKRSFGIQAEMRFRNLDTLDRIDPPPLKEPFKRTVVIAENWKKTQAEMRPAESSST